MSSQYATMTSGERVRWIDTAECAKLVRAALKAAFPATKFSVRSDRYSGGSSVDVHWTDGPTSRHVEDVAQQFQGSTFDGMQDLRSYHTSDLNGERVRYAADHVSCQRRLSAAHLRRIATDTAARYGFAVPTVTEYSDGTGSVPGYTPLNNAQGQAMGYHQTVQQEVLEAAYRTDANGPTVWR